MLFHAHRTLGGKAKGWPADGQSLLWHWLVRAMKDSLAAKTLPLTEADEEQPVLIAHRDSKIVAKWAANLAKHRAEDAEKEAKKEARPPSPPPLAEAKGEL